MLVPSPDRTPALPCLPMLLYPYEWAGQAENKGKSALGTGLCPSSLVLPREKEGPVLTLILPRAASLHAYLPRPPQAGAGPILCPWTA